MNGAKPFIQREGKTNGEYILYNKMDNNKYINKYISKN